MANDKVNELLKKLESGVQEFYNTEKWKDMLNLQSKLHKYSWNNLMLIWCQNPSATMVAGFNTWKNLGRYVKKGEKAIQILAPMFKKLEEGDKQDPTVPEGKKLVWFKVVSVFDVSQTDGKPLPEDAGEPETNSETGQQILNALSEIIDIPVIYGPVEGGAMGYFHRSTNSIVVQEGMSTDATAKVLLHEYAHSVLHHKDSDYKGKKRGQRETEAEGVAYVVSKYLGLDTDDFSFEYIAGWAHEEEGVALIKKVANTIQKTSSEIIEKLEKAMGKKDMAVGA